jgi:hypothetical protein
MVCDVCGIKWSDEKTGENIPGFLKVSPLVTRCAHIEKRNGIKKFPEKEPLTLHVLPSASHTPTFAVTASI